MNKNLRKLIPTTIPTDCEFVPDLLESQWLFRNGNKASEVGFHPIPAVSRRELYPADDEFVEQGGASEAAAAESARQAAESASETGMPLGAAFPYTGRDVPAGTLRADGTTYTGMQASFPDFFAWVKQSGLAVPMADYALVEGSCGRYGLDESTGSVRMPTLAAGVFGAGAASEYGQAVEAGLPGITGTVPSTRAYNATGAFYKISGSGYNHGSGLGGESLGFDASLSSPVYGKSDTVTPSHVKYPWVIVVYNAAVPASVAEAAEFVGLLEGKAGTSLENVTAEGKARAVGWGMPDYTAGVSKSWNTEYTAEVNGWVYAQATDTASGATPILSIENAVFYIGAVSSGAVQSCICVPVKANQAYKAQNGTEQILIFYPCAG